MKEKKVGKVKKVLKFRKKLKSEIKLEKKVEDFFNGRKKNEISRKKQNSKPYATSRRAPFALVFRNNTSLINIIF